ncbi:MAG: RibD family protein [Thermodesulfobacteriota bacterium]
MTPRPGLFDKIRSSLHGAPRRPAAPDRPYITLSYAQSIDGSIASRSGRPLALSCSESVVLTHRIRAIHDAILVGIGTIFADNPLLTVRHVAGESPQPVIVDSRLRLPLDARVLRQNHKAPWIATTEQADAEREKTLVRSGATVLHIQSQPDGLIDLEALLRLLKQMDIQTVMVEGGSQVITSFLKHRLVDQLVLTLAPVFIGGIQAVWPQQLSLLDPPRLEAAEWEMCGSDLVLRADIVWRDP